MISGTMFIFPVYMALFQEQKNNIRKIKSFFN